MVVVVVAAHMVLLVPVAPVAAAAAHNVILLLLEEVKVVPVDQTAAIPVLILRLLAVILTVVPAGQIQVAEAEAPHTIILLVTVVTEAPELSSLNINSNKIKENNKWHYQ